MNFEKQKQAVAGGVSVLKNSGVDNTGVLRELSELVSLNSGDYNTRVFKEYVKSTVLRIS